LETRLGKSSQDTISTNKPDVVAIQERAGKTSLTEVSPRPKKCKTYLKKKLKQKRDGNMAQVVECLPGKYKALSPNPSTKNKTKKIKAEERIGKTGIFK
jgi:hypothetical protein